MVSWNASESLRHVVYVKFLTLMSLTTSKLTIQWSILCLVSFQIYNFVGMVRQADIPLLKRDCKQQCVEQHPFNMSNVFPNATSIPLALSQLMEQTMLKSRRTMLRTGLLVHQPKSYKSISLLVTERYPLSRTRLLGGSALVSAGSVFAGVLPISRQESKDFWNRSC
jgi:hypothetical protein